MNEPGALEAFEIIGSAAVLTYVAYNAKKIANYISKGLEKFVDVDSKKDIASKTEENSDEYNLHKPFYKN